MLRKVLVYNNSRLEFDDISTHVNLCNLIINHFKTKKLNKKLLLFYN